MKRVDGWEWDDVDGFILEPDRQWRSLPSDNRDWHLSEGVATGTVSATLSLARPRSESGLPEQSTEELPHG